MGRQTQKEDADRVDDAFNRVLAAEAEARERVKDCESAAAAILSDAETRIRRIKNHADRRMLRVHQIADAQVTRVCAEMTKQQPSETPAAPDTETLAKLDQAIAALIDEIFQSGIRDRS